MSSSPDQSLLLPRDEDVRLSEIEALADNLVALVDEFDASISKGRVPPAFAERLAELRQTVERLIQP